MLIIGEKINSSVKLVKPAMENLDEGFIQEMAKKQAEAGAHYLDLNCGTFLEDEPERLEWLVRTVQKVVSLPFSIDTPNPKALERALQANCNPKPIINSITDEKERFKSILPLALEYKTSIIALCMDDTGMPETAEDRFHIASRLIEKLTRAGISPDDIMIDPMVRPIGTGSHYGRAALDTISMVRKAYPEVHVACGLSNISFGIPARKLMNQVFLAAAMAAGMDGVILDPLDKRLMSMLYAAEALLGRDEYCMNYLAKYREGGLEF